MDAERQNWGQQRTLDGKTGGSTGCWTARLGTALDGKTVNSTSGKTAGQRMLLIQYYISTINPYFIAIDEFHISWPPSSANPDLIVVSS